MALIKLNLAQGVTGTLPTSNYTSGITMLDQWRVNTTFTNDAEPITANWERVDTDSFAQIGTGMTESSGIFTFPSTGIYHISFNLQTFNTLDNAYTNARILITTDNSSYDIASDGWNGAKAIASTTMYYLSHCETVFDVTNTSTHKVRFHSRVWENSTSTWGDSNKNTTYVTFKRIGDT